MRGAPAVFSRVRHSLETGRRDSEQQGASIQGSDIGFVTDGGANSSVTITNNMLYKYGNAGLLIQYGGHVSGGNAKLTAVVSTTP
jgi:hypothetical protein